MLCVCPLCPLSQFCYSIMLKNRDKKLQLLLPQIKFDFHSLDVLTLIYYFVCCFGDQQCKHKLASPLQVFIQPHKQ